MTNEILARAPAVALLLLAGACASDGAADAGADTAGDADADTDADADADADADGDADPGGSCAGEPVPCAGLGWYWCEGQQGCTLSTSCSGEAWPCDSVPIADCGTQLGCTFTGSCAGVAAGCGTFLGALQCAAQAGCTWVWQDEWCGGTPTPCGNLDPASCAGQQGCSLVGGSCSGTAAGCLGLDGSQCTYQLGCDPSDECAGTPAPCESFDQSPACWDQLGCQWVPAGQDAGTDGDTDTWESDGG